MTARNWTTQQDYVARTRTLSLQTQLFPPSYVHQCVWKLYHHEC